MDKKILAWLADIDNSIDKIFNFLGTHYDFNLYKKDVKNEKSRRAKYRNYW